MSHGQSRSFAEAMHGIAGIESHGTSAAGIDKRTSRFDQAIGLMEGGRWQQAFTLLAELADAGHPQAARIALLFVRRGSLLFGGTYRAHADQRQCWQRASDI